MGGREYGARVLVECAGREAVGRGEEVQKKVRERGGGGGVGGGGGGGGEAGGGGGGSPDVDKKIPLCEYY